MVTEREDGGGESKLHWGGGGMKDADRYTEQKQLTLK